MNFGFTIHLSPSVERLLLDHHRETLAAIRRMEHRIMATAETILAKITAQTTVLQGVAAAVDGLDEGQTSIAALIADLKEQIAAGGTPDFAPIEAALDEQGAVIDGIDTAIRAGT